MAKKKSKVYMCSESGKDIWYQRDYNEDEHSMIKKFLSAKKK